MKGFKDSTKVQYMSGGMVGDAKMPMKKACGGSVKMPMKKAMGGSVKMPSPAESAASGNRMAEMEAKEERMLMRRAPGEGAVSEREMREMKKRVPATRREPMLPPVGESVKSGNRMSAQEGAEARKMQTGGRVSPADMYKQLQARLAQAKAAAAKPSPKAALPPATASKTGGIGAALFGAKQPPKSTPSKGMAPARPMPVTSRTPPKISPRNPFVDTMPRVNVPSGPPPAGMAPVDPSKAAMMKKGGLAVMPKGKC